MSEPRLGGETEFHGPRIGDEVEITVRGVVTELAVREGVAGLRVRVRGMINDPWRPLDEAVILSRRTRG